MAVSTGDQATLQSLLHLDEGVTLCPSPEPGWWDKGYSMMVLMGQTQ